jgi:hypothetical protein
MGNYIQTAKDYYYGENDENNENDKITMNFIKKAETETETKIMDMNSDTKNNYNGSLIDKTQNSNSACHISKQIYTNSLSEEDTIVNIDYVKVKPDFFNSRSNILFLQHLNKDNTTTKLFTNMIHNILSLNPNPPENVYFISQNDEIWKMNFDTISSNIVTNYFDEFICYMNRNLETYNVLRKYISSDIRKRLSKTICFDMTNKYNVKHPTKKSIRSIIERSPATNTNIHYYITYKSFLKSFYKDHSFLDTIFLHFNYIFVDHLEEQEFNVFGEELLKCKCIYDNTEFTQLCNTFCNLKKEKKNGEYIFFNIKNSKLYLMTQ